MVRLCSKSSHPYFPIPNRDSPDLPATAGAGASNGPCGGTGASRGHSSEDGPSLRPKLVNWGSTAPTLPETMTPSGRVSAQRRAEHEHFKATRSHRACWFMAGTSIVQRALNNEWLAERGVPNLKQQWVEMHYGQQNPQFNPAAVNLTGTA